jgi:urea transport system ATP-binding protein
MTTLLEVSGVSVTFDGFRAINNLSIQIAEPELRAVIGPNRLLKNPAWTGI